MHDFLINLSPYVPAFRLIYNFGLVLSLGFLAFLILIRDSKGKGSLTMAALIIGFLINIANESMLFFAGISEIFSVPIGYYYLAGNLARGAVPYIIAAYALHVYISRRPQNIKFSALLDILFSNENELARRAIQAEYDAAAARSNAQLLRNYLRIISHELKTPATTMANFSDLAVSVVNRTEMDPESKTKLSRYLRTIISSSEILADLIGGLVDYNLATNPKKPSKAIPLMEAIESAINISGLEQGAIVTMEQGTPPEIWGGDDIARIFLNIFSNALRYKSPDRPLSVDIMWTTDKDHCLVSISDNGIGFPPENAEKVFDMFKSAHDGNPIGTGMGMAIARGIARRYEGDVWAEQNHPHGAIFHIKFRLQGKP